MAAMKLKHRVQLSERHRHDLIKCSASGHGSAREMAHIRIILKSDEGPGRRDEAIARALDGQAEAHPVALSCSNPPAGRTRWSRRLLANCLVELQVVEAVSDETVRRELKKRALAVADAAVEHLAQGQRRARLADGSRAGSGWTNRMSLEVSGATIRGMPPDIPCRAAEH